MMFACAGSPLLSCWKLIQEAPYWVPAPGQEVMKVSSQTAAWVGLGILDLYDIRRREAGCGHCLVCPRSKSTK